MEQAMTAPETARDPLRTKAPFGWAASASTLFVWDDAEHTKWHAVYDLIDRSHADRNLSQEVADAKAIAALLNATPAPTADEDKPNPWIDPLYPLPIMATNAAWEAMLTEVESSIGYSPASVIVARHRPLITAAIRRAPSPDTLDVERLAEAMWEAETNDSTIYRDRPFDHISDTAKVERREKAARIATEYAAILAARPRETEE
jgi:hypothetical protein